MLPKADLDIIRKAKEGKAGEGIDRVNDHLTPIMVLYGLADMELLEEDFVTITIAEDLRQLLIPHIDWALEYEHNQQRMGVEIIVEGLANILGIVTQNEIRKYLKLSFLKPRTDSRKTRTDRQAGGRRDAAPC